MKKPKAELEFAGTFTIRPNLNLRQRLALATGARLVVEVQALSKRDPVEMAVTAVAHTTRNGDAP